MEDKQPELYLRSAAYGLTRVEACLLLSGADEALSHTHQEEDGTYSIYRFRHAPLYHGQVPFQFPKPRENSDEI